MKKIRVLMVCMGNICRSPTAQGVFEQWVREAGLEERIEVDSAGTHAYHVGESPDSRSQEAALRRGIDLSAQRARRVDERDFAEFDYVLAMDAGNYRDLMDRCRDPDGCSRIRLFMEFAPENSAMDVPDPYYGGVHGFERVLDLVEEAATGLLKTIRDQHAL